jgi:AcrR family transcriptional regulator
VSATLGLRERKKLGTRWALSDAALELALERGLDNVTREDIANRAGVSLRTFNNYFTGKYEAISFRQIERTRQSLAVFRERPADEPLWSAITESMLAPLEAEGAADMRPTHEELVVIRQLLSARDLRAALTRNLFADWVDAIAERTGTDPARDMYPRLVAAVVRAVGETAMEAYAYADPPVAYTELLRRGLAEVAAGLPERCTHCLKAKSPFSFPVRAQTG